MSNIYHEWRELIDALRINDGPIPDYQILQRATKRIKALEAEQQTEHTDCIKAAKDVLGRDVQLHFAHQAVWALVAEVRRLRAAWSQQMEDHP